MKFGVVNKSTTVNRFVLHTLQRNITHLAVITHKTNIKLFFEENFDVFRKITISLKFSVVILVEATKVQFLKLPISSSIIKANSKNIKQLPPNFTWPLVFLY